MVDFSEEVRKLYIKLPKEFASILTPVLIDLTKTPHQKQVSLGREFVHGISRPSIYADYNGALGAIDVSVKLGNYGRKVYVFVDREHSGRALKHVRGLNKKIREYISPRD
jgi:hypothetical protein